MPNAPVQWIAYDDIYNFVDAVEMEVMDAPPRQKTFDLEGKKAAEEEAKHQHLLDLYLQPILLPPKPKSESFTYIVHPDMIKVLDEWVDGKAEKMDVVTWYDTLPEPEPEKVRPRKRNRGAQSSIQPSGGRSKTRKNEYLTHNRGKHGVRPSR